MNKECGISGSSGIEYFRVPFVVSFELGHLSPMWPTFVSDHSTQNSNLIKYQTVRLHLVTQNLFHGMVEAALAYKLL